MDTACVAVAATTSARTGPYSPPATIPYKLSTSVYMRARSSTTVTPNFHTEKIIMKLNNNYS